jgi:hypothetical protein
MLRWGTVLVSVATVTNYLKLWVMTIEIYSLIVLKVRNLKSKY